MKIMDEKQERLSALRCNLAHDLDSHFEQLVNDFQQPLFVFAYGFSGCSQDAEDVVQDSFVRAYRALRGYENDRIRSMALQAWLYRICLNLLRNRVRKRRPHTVQLEGNGHMPIEPTAANPIADEYERVEQISEIRSHLSRLPDRYRSAVILRFVNDLSYAQISQALQQPEGTVKSHVHRGLATLEIAITEREGQSHE